MSNIKLGSDIRYLINSFPASMTNIQRETILATCVARAIATMLPLPSSAVNEINSHYTMTHSQTVMELVSGFNESFVLDIRVVMDLTFKFYKLRYDVCHGMRDNPTLLSIIAQLSPDNFPPKVNELLKRECTKAEGMGDYYESWDAFIDAFIREIKDYNRDVKGDAGDLAVR